MWSIYASYDVADDAEKLVYVPYVLRVAAAGETADAPRRRRRSLGRDAGRPPRPRRDCPLGRGRPGPAVSRPPCIRARAASMSSGSGGRAITGLSTAPPTVSIVIPTKDRWSLFSRTALRSALEQEDVDYEVIVVDDGSADGTC